MRKRSNKGKSHDPERKCDKTMEKEILKLQNLIRRWRENEDRKRGLAILREQRLREYKLQDE